LIIKKDYNTIKQNFAGDIVFGCGHDYVNVYISNETYNYDTSFLKMKI